MSIFNSSITINQLTLPNRLVMPPMATEQSASGGAVSEQLVNYYREKSNGGYIGLIITEHAYISPEGQASPGQLSIADDATTDGLSKLTTAIHQNGSKVFAQLNHAGGAARKAITGCDAIGVTSEALPNGRGDVPKEMTREEIARLVECFAAAAIRAKKAGFDGVEIHSAHGYLLNQFYSPLSNHRQDEYTGKTLEGRTRFHLEVIGAVRDAVGANYPVALRLGACDYRDGGSTIEDSVTAAVLFEQAGIDLLDISGGFCGYTNPTYHEQGYFCALTDAIKQACSIPVLLTGGITTADAAERLLQQHKADLIGVGRAILQNSTWAADAVTSLR